MSLPCAFGIEVQLERIFRHPAFEAGAGPGRALEERGLVVAGPGVAAGAGLADVAGEHQRQIGRAIHLGGVEPVVDAFALMDRHRLDRRDVLRELLDQRLRRAA